MRTARKSPVAGKINLPFAVPAPIDRAIQTAAEKVGAVRTETLEVANKVEARVKSAASTVRRKGQTIAKNPQGFVNEVVRDARGGVDKVRTGLSREAGKLADDPARRIGGAVTPVIETTLHRLNVPTQRELKTLSTKVDGLSRKIDALNKPRATRTTRARKAS